MAFIVKIKCDLKKKEADLNLKVQILIKFIIFNTLKKYIKFAHFLKLLKLFFRNILLNLQRLKMIINYFKYDY